MGLRWYTAVVDSRDVSVLGHWWADTLGWVVAVETDSEVVLVPPRVFDETRSIPLDEQGPGLAFVRVPDGKAGKNRLHLDLAPGPGDDQDGSSPSCWSAVRPSPRSGRGKPRGSSSAIPRATSSASSPHGHERTGGSRGPRGRDSRCRDQS